MFELERIDHVAITISDIENSIKWYKEVLGLEQYYDGAWDGVPIMMGKGGTCVALFKVREKNPIPSPGWKALAMQHLAFRADRKNFEKAQESLKENGIEFRFVDHEISHSIYFKDPDGHELEITTYEF
jgi:catechol 2,3-dioxygenase-like lactoylglutathione lyase family enzyme